MDRPGTCEMLPLPNLSLKSRPNIPPSQSNYGFRIRLSQTPTDVNLSLTATSVHHPRRIVARFRISIASLSYPFPRFSIDIAKMPALQPIFIKAYWVLAGLGILWAAFIVSLMNPTLQRQ